MLLAGRSIGEAWRIENLLGEMVLAVFGEDVGVMDEIGRPGHFCGTLIKLLPPVAGRGILNL